MPCELPLSHSGPEFARAVVTLDRGKLRLSHCCLWGVYSCSGLSPISLPPTQSQLGAVSAVSVPGALSGAVQAQQGEGGEAVPSRGALASHTDHICTKKKGVQHTMNASTMIKVILTVRILALEMSLVLLTLANTIPLREPEPRPTLGL